MHTYLGDYWASMSPDGRSWLQTAALLFGPVLGTLWWAFAQASSWRCFFLLLVVSCCWLPPAWDRCTPALEIEGPTCLLMAGPGSRLLLSCLVQFLKHCAELLHKHPLGDSSCCSLLSHVVDLHHPLTDAHLPWTLKGFHVSCLLVQSYGLVQFLEHWAELLQEASWRCLLFLLVDSCCSLPPPFDRCTPAMGIEGHPCLLLASPCSRLLLLLLYLVLVRIPDHVGQLLKHWAKLCTCMNKMLLVAPFDSCCWLPFLMTDSHLPLVIVGPSCLLWAGPCSNCYLAGSCSRLLLLLLYLVLARSPHLTGPVLGTLCWAFASSCWRCFFLLLVDSCCWLPSPFDRFTSSFGIVGPSCLLWAGSCSRKLLLLLYLVFVSSPHLVWPDLGILCWAFAQASWRCFLLLLVDSCCCWLPFYRCTSSFVIVGPQCLLSAGSCSRKLLLLLYLVLVSRPHLVWLVLGTLCWAFAQASWRCFFLLLVDSCCWLPPPFDRCTSSFVIVGPPCLLWAAPCFRLPLLLLYLVLARSPHHTGPVLGTFCWAFAPSCWRYFFLLLVDSCWWLPPPFDRCTSSFVIVGLPCLLWAGSCSRKLLLLLYLIFVSSPHLVWPVLGTLCWAFAQASWRCLLLLLVDSCCCWLPFDRCTSSFVIVGPPSLLWAGSCSRKLLMLLYDLVLVRSLHLVWPVLGRLCWAFAQASWRCFSLLLVFSCCCLPPPFDWCTPALDFVGHQCLLLDGPGSRLLLLVRIPDHVVPVFGTLCWAFAPSCWRGFLLLLVDSFCWLPSPFERLIVLMSCTFMLEMIIAPWWLMMLNATSLDSMSLVFWMVVLAAEDCCPDSLTCHLMPGLSKS